MKAWLVTGYDEVREVLGRAEGFSNDFGNLADPGSLAHWRPLVNGSATRVDEACGVLADALYEGRDPRAAPVAVAPAPDTLVVDVQAWLAGVADDLTRLSADSSKEHR